MGGALDSLGRSSAPAARVLVVDDSRVVRVVVKGYLRSTGYAVDEAGDGISALQLLDAGSYDVVVSDLVMPGMDGLGLLQALRERPNRPEVILLTGSPTAEMDLANRALHLGAHDYLTKPPAGPDIVVLAVERALEKKRLRDANRGLAQQLEILKRADPLTGLLNRRAFEETLANETARAQRYGLPLSLILLDLDHFGQINEAHGIAGGDEVLKHFARLARTSFRESDQLFRYGGEELAALLPHTALPGAIAAARRIVTLAAEAPAVVCSTVVRFTCSAGVAALEGPDTAAELLARADAALDQAKSAGRNQVRSLAAPPALTLRPGLLMH